MKKEDIYKFLYAISIFLIISFAVILKIDYSKYNTYNNSAPFYALIIVRTIEFLVPSIILFIIGKIIKTKHIK